MMRTTYEGIDFDFLAWDTMDDGDIGHIKFRVDKGTIKLGSNNGAYCLDAEGFDLVLSPGDNLCWAAMVCIILAICEA